MRWEMLNVLHLPGAILTRVRDLLWTPAPYPLRGLPVGGLAEPQASSISFALKNLSVSEEDERQLDNWMDVLELSQALSDRLQWELLRVEDALQFWRYRQEHGRHVSQKMFMLLSRGPISFLKDVLGALRITKPSPVVKSSAADKIERRVLYLRNLRSLVAAQLQHVSQAAGRLRMEPEADVADTDLDASSLPGAGTPSQSRGASQQLVLSKAWTKLGTASQELLHVVQELIRAAETASSSREDSKRLKVAAMKQALSGRMLPAFFHIEREGSRPTLNRNPPPSRTAGATPAHNGADESATAGAAGSQDEEEELALCDATRDRIERAHRLLGITRKEQRPGSVSQLLARPPRVATPLVVIPDWAAAPSSFQRHWLANLLVGSLLVSGSTYILRHSRLAGSTDLDDWVLAALNASRGAYRSHVVKPLVALQGELFKTFRERPGTVSLADYNTSLSSLKRMLTDFEADVARNGELGDAQAPGGLQGDRSVTRGMEVVMRSYEDGLKAPLRNVVNGSLARSMLIQVQKVKVDSESAMLQLDQILRANELNVALVAAVPAFVLAGIVTTTTVRWVVPSPKVPSREAQPVRMAMVELERAAFRAMEEATPEAEGMYIARLGIVHRLASTLYNDESLFRRKDATSARSEWPSLRADIVELAGLSSSKARTRLIKRMMRVYTVLQVATL